MDLLRTDENITHQQDAFLHLSTQLGTILAPADSVIFLDKFRHRKGDPNGRKKIGEAVSFLHLKVGTAGLLKLADFMFRAGNELNGGLPSAGATRSRTNFYTWGRVFRRYLRKIGETLPPEPLDEERPSSPQEEHDPLLAVLDQKTPPEVPVEAPQEQFVNDAILAMLDAESEELHRRRETFLLCEAKLEEEFESIARSVNHGQFVRCVPYVWKVPNGKENLKVLLSTMTFVRNDKVFDRGCVVDEKKLDGTHPALTRHPKSHHGLIKSIKIVPDREQRYSRMLDYREGMLFRIFVEERREGRGHAIRSLAWYGVCDRGEIRELKEIDYNARVEKLPSSEELVWIRAPFERPNFSGRSTQL